MDMEQGKMENNLLTLFVQPMSISESEYAAVVTHPKSTPSDKPSQRAS